MNGIHEVTGSTPVWSTIPSFRCSSTSVPRERALNLGARAGVRVAVPEEGGFARRIPGSRRAPTSRSLLFRVRGGAMRMGEPPDEGVERFAGRGAVEGHQSGRDPGRANQAGAPAVLERASDFDDVALAADGLFEAVNGHLQLVGRLAAPSGECGIVMSRRNQTSEDRRECRVHRTSLRQASRESARNGFSSAKNHRLRTGLPQCLRRRDPGVRASGPSSRFAVSRPGSWTRDSYRDYSA